MAFHNLVQVTKLENDLEGITEAKEESSLEVASPIKKRQLE